MSQTQNHETATERTRLLGGQSANGHINDDAEDPPTEQTDGADEVVLAETPSTRKLVIILLACFTGVFFAALGTTNTIPCVFPNTLTIIF